MSEHFYTFEVAGEHVGYSKLVVTANRLYSETRAAFHAVVINNIFELQLQAGRVTAFKYNKNAWMSMDDYPDNVWPSSAYPLFLEKAQPVFEYGAIDESSGEVVPTHLIREGNVIIEYVGEKVTRTFWLDGESVIKIDWGGALSALCDTFEESIAGTRYI